jgi:hypothetical protein
MMAILTDGEKERGFENAAISDDRENCGHLSCYCSMSEMNIPVLTVGREGGVV